MIEDFERVYHSFCDRTGYRITGSSTDGDIFGFIERIKEGSMIIDEDYIRNILFELRDLLRRGYDEQDAWDYIIGDDYIWRE
jgi:hypothetical protein